MIVDERFTTYLNSLYEPLEETLASIEKEALSEEVPIIRKETQNLMRTLLAVKKPKNILEVGTAVGFSCGLMAQSTSDDCHIITIENYEPRFEKARNNFSKLGITDRVTFLTGDAMEILPTIEGKFDFIFMDAAKGQYINFWPEIKRLVSDEGMIVTDNVLQDGDIIESRYAVTRRNRTIHKRMRDYLYELTHDKDFETSIIPMGDGICISVKG